jgi:hypothetical protein
MDGWDYGFRSWRDRAAPVDSLAFVCELGPKPYAIVNREWNDTTDHWAGALLLKAGIESL